MTRTPLVIAVGTAVAVAAALTAGPANAQPSGPSAQSAAARDGAQLAATKADALVASRPSYLHASATTRSSAAGGLLGRACNYVPYERTYKGLPVRGGDFVVVTDAAGRTTFTSVAQTSPIGELSDHPEDLRQRGAGHAPSSSSRRCERRGHRARRGRRRGRGGAAGLGDDGQRHRRRGRQPADRRRRRGHRQGAAHPGARHRGHRHGHRLDQRLGLAQHHPVRLDVPAAGPGAHHDPLPGRADNAHVQRPGQRLGQRQRHQQGDRLRRRVLRGAEAVRDAVGLARPQRAERQRRRLADPGRPERRERVLRRHPGADRPQHRRASGSPRPTSSATSWATASTTTPRAASPRRGTQEFVADTFGAATEWFANNPNDPPDYLVGEEVNLVGSGPIRNMYNPSLAGDSNCYSSSTPSQRGARRGRPRQPLVLPAGPGHAAATASRPARPATAARSPASASRTP